MAARRLRVPARQHQVEFFGEEDRPVYAERARQLMANYVLAYGRRTRNPVDLATPVPSVDEEASARGMHAMTPEAAERVHRQEQVSNMATDGEDEVCAASRSGVAGKGGR